MKTHTVILETPRREISNIGLNLFVQELIKKNRTKIEYFGDQIDNQADYVDEEMQLKIDTTTFIEINFESEQGLDYDSYAVNDIHALILHHLDHSKNREFNADQKDIIINLS